MCCFLLFLRKRHQHSPPSSKVQMLWRRPTELHTGRHLRAEPEEGLSTFLQQLSGSCLTLCNPKDCSPLDSSVWGFPRQEYWSRLPYPPPGDLPDPGIEPSLMSSASAGLFFTITATWEAHLSMCKVQKICVKEYVTQMR